MSRPHTLITALIFSLYAPTLLAATARMPQFANDDVTVWKTIIAPHATQKLSAHRHEHDRVLVAFNDGLLKIVNNSGKMHYLKLEKNKSYYLRKDPGSELHTDENMSSHPLEVMVIELNNS